MLAKLKTFSLLGIDALPVEVEVDVSPAGLPKTLLVGLPEAAVKESTHRVERAMVNSGFQRPQNRVVINLAPACSRLSQREVRVFPLLLARFLASYSALR
jgi:magnesium chelatase family protein